MADGNWNVLVADLNRQGVEVRFKHKGQTNEVQGIVFLGKYYLSDILCVVQDKTLI